MKAQITNEKENELYSRTEVSYDISYDKEVPSKQALRDKASSDKKADKKMVIVKEIMPNNGEQTAKGLVYVYKDEQVMKDLEDIKEEPKAEEAAPAAEEKKEAPKEEPEEKKEEKSE